MRTGKLREARWSDIAFDSALVIGICQRRSGLWAYPTNDDDRGKVYAIPNGLEERERLQSEFGYGSITATWNALEALVQLFPQFPRYGIQKAIAEINDCRGKIGYFGSKAVTFQGHRIIESTRHTALALLSNFFFAPPGSIDWEFLGKTVDWLLKQQLPELDGGWPFDHSTSDASEPMSTASCIAALSCYLAFEKTEPGAVRTKKIRQAIHDGFVHLMNTKKSNLWVPRYIETHINDNVFVLDMFDQAIRRGNFLEIVPQADAELTNIGHELCAAGLPTGWPANWGGQSPSLAATVGVLYLNEMRALNAKRQIERGKRFVAEEMSGRTGAAQLVGWNWIMLGRLASKHHVLSNEQACRALELIAKFKIAQELKIPSLDIIGLFPEAVQATATYILSRGKHLSAPYDETKQGTASTDSELTSVGNTPRYKRHVFLSYCRDNQDEAAQLRDDLIAKGEIVWWDQDIQPGQDFRFEIRRAIKAAYAMVMCFSKEAAARKTSGMFPEARDAIVTLREYPPGSIFLIPVRLSECEIPPVELDSTRALDQLQYIDLFPPERRDHKISELIRALRATPYHPNL